MTKSDCSEVLWIAVQEVRGMLLFRPRYPLVDFPMAQTLIPIIGMPMSERDDPLSGNPGIAGEPSEFALNDSLM